MRTPAFSASKTGLAHACGHWIRSDVERPEQGAASWSSVRGTKLHKELELYLMGELEGDPSPAVLAAALWLSRLAADGYGRESTRMVEPAFGWDPTTGASRFLGRGRESYVHSTSTEECGTGDFLVGDDSSVTVVDVKTGEPGARKATQQLRTLAVMAGAHFGVGSVRCISLFVNPDSGEVRPFLDFWMDAFDLEDHADQLRADLVDGREAEPGDHCTDGYCDFRSTCAARAAHLEGQKNERAAVVDRARLPVIASVPALAARKGSLIGPITSADDVAYRLLVRKAFAKWDEDTARECRAWCDANVEGELRVDEGTVYMRKKMPAPSPLKAMRELAIKLGASEDEVKAETERLDAEHERRRAAAFEALAVQHGATPEDLALCVSPNGGGTVWGMQSKKEKKAA